MTSAGLVCEDTFMCFFTMLRLSFYDGTGFDYLTSLAQDKTHGNSHGYTVLLILFTIWTTIIILNGLIGIFGSAFSLDDTEDKLRLADKEDIILVLKELQADIKLVKQKLSILKVD